MVRVDKVSALQTVDLSRIAEKGRKRGKKRTAVLSERKRGRTQMETSGRGRYSPHHQQNSSSTKTPVGQPTTLKKVRRRISVISDGRRFQFGLCL